MMSYIHPENIGHPTSSSLLAMKGERFHFWSKSNQAAKDSLKWTAKYVESLWAYADLMKLPLLVAWKKHGLWVLADSSLFVRRHTAYHLTFDRAVKNSLMSILFGNVWITFAEGFRLEFNLKIMDEVDLTADLLPEGSYHLRIEDAGFWTRKGRLSGADGNSPWWFLITAAADSRFDRVGDVATQLRNSILPHLKGCSISATCCWPNCFGTETRRGPSTGWRNFAKGCRN